MENNQNNITELDKNHAQKIAEASRVLKAASHKQRLLILCLLGENELSVSEIVNLSKICQPTVSQHLQRLRLENLVDYRKDGKQIIYALKSPVVKDIITVLHQYYCSDLEN